jgi:hypothetical protein
MSERVWWPRKCRISIGGTDQYLTGHVHAWWQWRRRRRMSDVRNLERFDWRTIRFSFRRPADHWRNDPPST